MNIHIKNLGTIDEGNIVVKENMLNIKYGMNGTGKSTISKGILNTVESKSLDELKKYGSDITPTVEIDQKIKKVLIFNEEYVDNYLFKDDIAHNSFEIIVNNQSYQGLMNNMDKTYNSLFDHLSNIDTSILLENLEDIDDKLRIKETAKGKLSINGSTKFMKSRKISKIKDKLNERTKPYEKYILNRIGYKWKDWFDEGKQYQEIQINTCPYCLKPLDEHFNDIHSDLNELSTNQVLKHSAEVMKSVNFVKPLLNEEQSTVLNNVLNHENTIKQDEYQVLNTIKIKAKQEYDKIKRLKSCDSTAFAKKFENNSLEEFMYDCMLDEKYFKNIDDRFLKTVKEINKDIRGIIDNQTELKRSANRLAEILNKSISPKKNMVNDYFKTAGIPYEIEIQNLGNRNFKTVLKPIGVDQSIKDNRLSYGERNAVAIILFALEAEKNADFVILDDPVSSFDNTKKFAIFYHLFLNKNNDSAPLKNKTVLMFTHDFDVVSNFMFKNKLHSYNHYCTYIRNCGGQIKETIIKKRNVIATLALWKQRASDEDNSKIVRTVNLRKYVDYMKDRSFAYEILSGIEHGKMIPQKKINEEYIDLTEEEILSGEEFIKQFINDFDYDQYLSAFKNKEELREAYFTTTYSVEKLQIVRAYLNQSDHKLNDVIYDFVTGVYHVENNEMMCLDETSYERIPGHILAFCDEVMNK